MWLLIAFIAVPLIEIGLFIQVGGWLGLWPTLGIVLLTAVIGTAMVRSQGLQVLQNLQASMEGNGDPAEQIPPGTPFLELPGYWRCPQCDAEPSAFLPVEG